MASRCAVGGARGMCFVRETHEKPAAPSIANNGEHLVMLGMRPWSHFARLGLHRADGSTLEVLLRTPRFRRVTYVHFERRWGLRVNAEPIQPGAEALGVPAGLPLTRFRPLRWISRRLQARILARRLEPAEAGGRTFWLYDWGAVDVARRLGPGRYLLEISDDPHRVHAKSPSKLRDLPAQQRAAVRNMDLLVAVRPELFQDLGDEAADRRVVVPNGISSAFLAAGSRSWEEPVALKNRPRPRLIVVAGEWSFEHCVDHPLLAEALQRLEGWTLVLVGVPSRPSPSLGALIDHPRVVALPVQPNLELPPLLAAGNVGAVPYRPPGGGRDVLKTYEYLACGLPAVVTVDEPLASLAPWIQTAPCVDSFVEACRTAAAVGLERPEVVRERLADLTWERRTLRLLERLDEIAPGNVTRSPLHHSDAPPA